MEVFCGKDGRHKTLCESDMVIVLSLPWVNLERASVCLMGSEFVHCLAVSRSIMIERDQNTEQSTARYTAAGRTSDRLTV